MYEDENAAEIIFVTSVIECTLVCASTTQCLSLFYNAITKSCIIHPDPFFYTILTKTEPGWKIYATQDRTCFITQTYNGHFLKMFNY